MFPSSSLTLFKIFFHCHVVSVVGIDVDRPVFRNGFQFCFGKRHIDVILIITVDSTVIIILIGCYRQIAVRKDQLSMPLFFMVLSVIECFNVRFSVSFQDFQQFGILIFLCFRNGNGEADISDIGIRRLIQRTMSVCVEVIRAGVILLFKSMILKRNAESFCHDGSLAKREHDHRTGSVYSQDLRCERNPSLVYKHRDDVDD